ncbi:MAG: Na-translocating system protein MpsB [Sneathiellaceae bacterium]
MSKTPVAADAHAMEAQLHAALDAAAERLPHFFPLDAFVASNPLQGFEHLSFDEAVAQAHMLCGGRGQLPLEHYRERVARGRLEPDRLRAAVVAALPAHVASLAGHDLPFTDYLLARIVDGAVAPPDALLAAANAAATRAGLGTNDGAAGWPAEHTTLLAWLDTRLAAGLVERRDALVCAFLRACLLADDDTALPPPGATTGLYTAFRRHLLRDPLLDGVAAGVDIPRVALLPDAPEAAVLGALAALGLDPDRRAGYLCQQLFSLKGWAAFVAWHAHGARAQARPARLLDLLAVLLVTERLLWLDLALAHGLPSDLHGLVAHLPHVTAPAESAAATALAAFAAWHDLPPTVLDEASADEVTTLTDTLMRCNEDWLALRCLEAEELAYRDDLLTQLAAPAPATAACPAGRPRAQMAFCIDVRSEPLRRALEAQGAYDTYGYAGFFGIALSYARLDGSTSAQCPVLLEPAYHVHEQAAPRLPAQTRRQHVAGARFAGLLPAIKRALKRHPLASFGVVDGFGLLSVWPLLRDAIRPAAPPPRAAATLGPWLEPDVAGDAVAATPGLPGDDEQFAIARAFFETTGLAAPFARLLVLCGHAASTTNNAYAGALDCGACGGHEGATNARLLAQILERKEIRERLAAHGIALPVDTHALAALHDTTTDRVTLFDDDLPASHTADARALARALEAAARDNRVLRALRLGTTAADLQRRAADAAETRPEWGLAGNAAFICAPRATTRGHDLGGRTFLHSYDWTRDGDGAVLTAIMSAPLVVAQWINAQYYFSSVDNATWGSGSKVTQNIVGGLAVMQGESGDLRLGLPAQSVQADDGRLYHEPLRLLAVIEAPATRISAVLASNETLRALFDVLSARYGAQ